MLFSQSNLEGGSSSAQPRPRSTAEGPEGLDLSHLLEMTN